MYDFYHKHENFWRVFDIVSHSSFLQILHQGSYSVFLPGFPLRSPREPESSRIEQVQVLQLDQAGVEQTIQGRNPEEVQDRVPARILKRSLKFKEGKGFRTQTTLMTTANQNKGKHQK